MFSLLACAATTTATAQCHPPAYVKGRDYVSPSFGKGAVQVAVQPKDLSLQSILCLVQTLRSQKSNWSDGGVEVFTDKIAAYNFVPPGTEDPGDPRDIKWASELHASYYFNTSQHDVFYILPLGYEEASSIDSTINLPLGAQPSHCTLELDDRCIMAIDSFVYPKQALEAKASGSITLQATITAGGEVRAIHVVRTDVKLGEKKRLFVDAAVRNLSKWRIDPASHESAVRITYSYEIVSSSSSDTRPEVQFKLPNQITIRVKTSE